MSQEPTERLLSMEELAAATGLSVRTTRYYASLGLLPPPQRQGRLALYSDQHRARLELVRALQDHGFTLAAIERYLARIPLDAGVEDLAVQRAMMTSWTGGLHETLSLAELEGRAGRTLDEESLRRLELFFAVRRVGERYEPLAPFEVAVATLDLDVPLDSMVAASEVIARHMDALADELTDILRTRVLAPLRRREPSGEESARLERTVTRLRRLTLEAVVAGFQRAADQVISRSLARSERAEDTGTDGPHGPS